LVPQIEKMNASQLNAVAVHPMRRALRVWLLVGLFMVFIQIVVGGITRLTGSGLSITKWEIVIGTLPPMNATEWDEAFNLYKATPQYQKINQGMSMGEFKFIFFWEYIHRLWARGMGLVFIFPFLFFWRNNAIEPALMKRLGITVLLAGLAATFGWIMVASGLVNRPWVNAYKLTLHLSIALAVFSYLLWTILMFFPPKTQVFHTPVLKKSGKMILTLLIAQIALGGLMSGMKAGLFYPTWPDMNGEFIPTLLFKIEQWNATNIIHYDSGPFMSALVQVLHRLMAYILAFSILYFFYTAWAQAKTTALKLGLLLMLSLLLAQVLLGILTVVNCVGTIPVGLGVLHQGVAVLLLASVLFVYFQVRQTAGLQIVDNLVDNSNADFLVR
jgi:cytochrome c oxidase assembly protein subunit 15